VHMEEAVLKVGTFHLDMIGKLEAALEAASRNTAMEIGHIFRLIAAASDGQHVLLYLDLEVGLAKACHGDRDAIGILAGPLNVIGRIGGAGVARHGIEQRLKLVEADGRTVKGGKVEIPHCYILFEAMFLPA